MADGKTKGRPRSGLDTIIAAIAQANECVVVTDNERDFCVSACKILDAD